MKVEMVKHPGGLLSPANDMEQEKLAKFKTGDQYTIEIKLPRNPRFHIDQAFRQVLITKQ